MTGPLLYRGAPKWQVWAAFGAAFAIHALAIGIAALNPEPPVMDLDDIPEAVVEVSVEEAQAEPQPTPPPEEEEPEPLDAPPEPIEPPEFQEEQPTPTPRPKTDRTPRPQAPIQRPSAPTGSTTISSAKAKAVFGPKPEYPYEARRARMTGSGVVVMNVDVGSGNVTSATIASSTGKPILDNAAVAAFRRWRFRPNSVPPRVKVPFTFTMTGAQF